MANSMGNGTCRSSVPRCSSLEQLKYVEIINPPTTTWPCLILQEEKWGFPARKTGVPPKAGLVQGLYPNLKFGWSFGVPPWLWKPPNAIKCHGQSWIQLIPGFPKRQPLLSTQLPHCSTPSEWLLRWNQLVPPESARLCFSSWVGDPRPPGQNGRWAHMLT